MTFLIALDVDGDGAHPAAWRRSPDPAAVLSAAAVAGVTTSAESAGFTLVTYADSAVPPDDEPGVVGRLEAGTRAAATALLTDRIGLAPELQVTTTEPFHVATQLAALDHASSGRGAWVVGTDDRTATVGTAPRTPTALRQEVRDAVEVARRLWDSWQDDAVIRDVHSGRFLDADRVHHVDFVGATFSVKGPLITWRPPQGQVVVLVPDHVGADDLADVVLISRTDETELFARAAAVRAAGALAVAEIDLTLDTDRSAARRLAELDSHTPWEGSGRFRWTGSPADLVDLLTRWAAHLDGVRFRPAVLREDGPVLRDHVLPVLRDRGVFTSPQRGATLRDTLGLARPANRFETAGATR